jgi:2-amino-4-hydroxy-6-hydroxymethyldihydropteridine diphosphokinase
MATVYLGLGANLGDRRHSLRRAVEQLAAHPEISIDGNRDVAPLYESDPLDHVSVQPLFLNTVIRAATTLSPVALLHVVQSIEASLGRVRDRRHAPRVIDIDILLYDRSVMNTPELVIPHRELTRRRFVLEPLAELAPGLVISGSGMDARGLRDAARRDLADQHVRQVEGGTWSSDTTNQASQSNRARG